MIELIMDKYKYRGYKISNMIMDIYVWRELEFYWEIKFQIIKYIIMVISR